MFDGEYTVAMENESNTELRLTVDQFARTLGGAAWAWNLDNFLKALNWEDEDYTREKFQQFQEIGRVLGRFDSNTLERLMVAYRASKAY